MHVVVILLNHAKEFRRKVFYRVKNGSPSAWKREVRQESLAACICCCLLNTGKEIITAKFLHNLAKRKDFKK